jgi:tetratricopeptide (TPR) repeat protein
MAATERRSALASWKAAHLDEIEELDDAGCRYRPVRLRLGLTAFGASVWTAQSAGDLVINEHDPGDPTADEELFLVIRGHAVFELDGERIEAPAGTFVSAPPGTQRRANATEAGTAILLIEGTPGKGYEPRGWELWAPLAPMYGAGRYPEVADALRAVVEAHPEYGMLFFNLACCESLMGKRTEALAHLRRAIELAEEFRDNARSDTDLDAIRDEPGFRELVVEAGAR